MGKSPKSSLTDLTNLVAKIMLDDENKQISAEDLIKGAKMYKYKFAQLYVEELEENLFPMSQFAMVKSIVKGIKSAYGKSGVNSYVVMTTHSPYGLRLMF